MEKTAKKVKINKIVYKILLYDFTSLHIKHIKNVYISQEGNGNSQEANSQEANSQEANSQEANSQEGTLAKVVGYELGFRRWYQGCQIR